jgi:hypothetical protein
VIKNEGKVDIYTGRQFVESFEKKLFKSNPEIRDQKAAGTMDSIGFETAVNLFESLSDRPMQGMSLYLDRLNHAMGLDKDYYRQRTKTIAEFFKPENSGFIEQKWSDAKASGLISSSEDSFHDAIADAFNHPEMVSRGDFLRRKALLQFISDSYSDYVQEPKVEVRLINGPSALGGYNAKDEHGQSGCCQHETIWLLKAGLYVRPSCLPRPAN